MIITIKKLWLFGPQIMLGWNSPRQLSFALKQNNFNLLHAETLWENAVFAVLTIYKKSSTCKCYYWTLSEPFRKMWTHNLVEGWFSSISTPLKYYSNCNHTQYFNHPFVSYLVIGTVRKGLKTNHGIFKIVFYRLFIFTLINFHSTLLNSLKHFHEI